MTSKILLFVGLCCLGFSSFSQTLNIPESICYDAAGERYFISNKGANEILTQDLEGNLAYFVQEGLEEPKAILIVGDTVISISNKSVQGFLLSDASRVLNVEIEGAQFMNGADNDDRGNLYVSDMNKHEIYKVDLSTGEYITFSTDVKSPNGVLFDAERNSILVCEWGGNAKIKSISLEDASMTVLVETQLSNLDGLAKDNCGNYYTSSWGANAVYAFESEFKLAPTKVSEGYNGPADIDIREDIQQLMVPNYSSNTIDFVVLGMGCAPLVTYTSPDDLSTDWSSTVSVSWEQVSSTTNYWVEYGTDGDFYKSEGIKATENLSSDLEELEANTTYFWRVAAKTDKYKFMYSNAWSFTTGDFEVGVSDDSNGVIALYPNPCASQLNFTTNVSHVVILNLAGQMLISQTEELSQLNVADLKEGTYVVQYQLENEIKQQLFIKQ